VITDPQSNLFGAYDVSLPSIQSEMLPVKSADEPILDLSQRPTTTTEMTDPWRRDTTCPYTDSVDDDYQRMPALDVDPTLDLTQPLTDQLQHHALLQTSPSDNSTPSRMDIQCSKSQNK
jgi:hypothetical protein